MPRRRLVVPVAALALVMGGCGGSSKPEFGTGKTAAEIVRALRAQGLPIGELTIYTPSTDPTHQLGQLQSYESKAYFRDSRIPPRGHDQSDTSGGGSVEVFSNVANAKDEEHNQHAIASGSAALAEYDYRRGRVFLRLSRKLTSAQARQYQRALGSLR